MLINSILVYMLKMHPAFTWLLTFGLRPQPRYRRVVLRHAIQLLVQGLTPPRFSPPDHQFLLSHSRSEKIVFPRFLLPFILRDEIGKCNRRTALIVIHARRGISLPRLPRSRCFFIPLFLFCPPAATESKGKHLTVSRRRQWMHRAFE